MVKLAFLEEFSQRIDLPAEAASALEKTYANVKDTENFKALSAMIAKKEAFEKIAETIKTDAEKLKLDWHTYAMAVLVRKRACYPGTLCRKGSRG